ncbi:hypothetical protein C8D77_114103 [Mesorhizobium loti]|uniref:Uncharacterized protein n=1 Tax=Rhizobium loti TaxID=381 RepID=A0A8E3B1Z6_RHILI|nr:hypothetical protein [Mesorhizobium loti]PWJ87812.1 hypothetical protein C8D77_114103 [Mesorhizobium loti]
MARRVMGLDEYDAFEVDESGQLFWKGKPVQFEQRVSLRRYELVLATLGAIGALLAGIHPFGASLGIW